MPIISFVLPFSRQLRNSVLSNMLLATFTPYCNEMIVEYRRGFRYSETRKSTCEQILYIRQILKGNANVNESRISFLQILRKDIIRVK